MTFKIDNIQINDKIGAVIILVVIDKLFLIPSPNTKERRRGINIQI